MVARKRNRSAPQNCFSVCCLFFFPSLFAVSLCHTLYTHTHQRSLINPAVKMFSFRRALECLTAVSSLIDLSFYLLLIRWTLASPKVTRFERRLKCALLKLLKIKCSNLVSLCCSAVEADIAVMHSITPALFTLFLLGFFVCFLRLCALVPQLSSHEFKVDEYVEFLNFFYQAGTTQC